MIIINIVLIIIIIIIYLLNLEFFNNELNLIISGTTQRGGSITIIHWNQYSTDNQSYNI